MSLNKRKSITSKELYNYVHPYDIFKFYCENWSSVNFEINKNFKADSSLRSEDISPSARITVSANNSLYYIDYGENKARGAIDFVKDKFNLTIAQSIEKIYNEVVSKNINVNTSKYISKINSTINAHKHKVKTIKIKSRKWTQEDLDYWKQFGWTLKFLIEAKITPISKYWIDNVRYDVFEPCYSFNYYFHENIFRRKLYFPYRKDNRFIGNIDLTVVQGWHMLPKEGGDILIITKAYKDIGTFKAIGLYACATNNETSFFPKEVVDKLKTRWKNIYIWWDNDKEGIKSGNKYADLYGLKFICNDLNSPKDPSDYYKKYGNEKLLNMVKLKLNL